MSASLRTPTIRSEPGYISGRLYFDTSISKLRIVKRKKGKKGKRKGKKMWKTVDGWNR